MEAPAAKAFHQGLLAARFDHEQHAFLGFREQKLVGRHALLAGRHPIEIQLDPDTPLGGHLRTTAGEASGAHVLGGDHIASLEGLQTSLDQALLQKRVPHLHGGAIVEGSRTEFGTGKAGAPHAITAGGTAHVHHWIANAGGTRTHDALGFHQAQGHGVDEGIAGIAGVETNLAAHGGHANTIAVMGDARHHPLQQAAIAGIFEGPKAQGIEQGDRSGAHREDVAQDAADSGGSPLERLDGRGMVMTLNLESQALTFAEIHHAGVFAGPHQDAGTAGGELGQQGSGVAIAAVLRPHDAEHAQLGPVGGAAQAPHDFVIIGLAQALLAQGIGHRKGQGGVHQSGANNDST